MMNYKNITADSTINTMFNSVFIFTDSSYEKTYARFWCKVIYTCILNTFSNKIINVCILNTHQKSMYTCISFTFLNEVFILMFKLLFKSNLPNTAGKFILHTQEIYKKICRIIKALFLT